MVELYINNQKSDYYLVYADDNGKFAIKDISVSKSQEKKIRLVASLGAVYSKKTKEFVLDPKAGSPVVKIKNITYGECFTQPITPKIQVKGKNVTDIKYRLNGKPWEPGTVIKEEGTYDLQVIATDLAGRRTTESCSFKIIPKEVKLERARELNQLGEKHYHKEVGNYLSKAIYYFKQATYFNPDYAQAYSNLGLAYLKAEKYKKSIKASKQAIKVADKKIVKASSHYNLAQAYEEQQKWEKALNHYQKALKYKEHSAYKEGIKRMKDKLN
jgi:tetratricopeptide (TPR) repeat protein